MFENDFPADDELCDYVTIWNAFKRITSPLAASDCAQLSELTARRTYRL